MRLAPAQASARDVSNPSPDAALVTMALRLLSDRPFAAASAVVRALRRDLMGVVGEVGEVGEKF